MVINPAVDPETGLLQEAEPHNASFPYAPLPRGLWRQTIRYFIDGRRIAVTKNPQLIKSYRWDQSDIFYPTRKLLDAKGYNTSALSEKEKRKKVYAYIKTYCDKLGIKRHEIGIFAHERAEMVYQGRTYPINYENYEELAERGVDIVCVEKEGPPDKWAPFTKHIGVAFVQSEGFVAEVGEWLAQKAKLREANVMVLTDFDADGLVIGLSVKGITRIGIDFDSIEEINAQIEAERKQAPPEDTLAALRAKDGMRLDIINLLYEGTALLTEQQNHEQQTKQKGQSKIMMQSQQPHP